MFLPPVFLLMRDKSARSVSTREPWWLMLSPDLELDVAVSFPPVSPVTNTLIGAAVRV